MKKIKLLIFILTFTYTSFLHVGILHAEQRIYFRPNIEIPGMENFFDVKVDVVDEEGAVVGYKYEIDGESIPRYISAVYSYAAVFAGVVAMFMLVFAAYQWLFAAGNAEKIGRARETIQGVLVGLTLLFGGNLLLSQISQNLVKFDSIVPTGITGQAANNTKCASIMAEQEALDSSIRCGDIYTTSTDGGRLTCVSTKCPNPNTECVWNKKKDTGLCPSAIAGASIDCSCEYTTCQGMFGASFTAVDRCDSYTLDEQCKTNACRGETIRRPDGTTKVFEKDCGIDQDDPEADCENLDGVGVFHNDAVACFNDEWCNNNTSVEYECVNGECRKK